MLRRILISLGLLIAFLPWLGFPHSWQAIISTIAGFAIVLMLLLTRRIRRENDTTHRRREDDGKALHVEHVEIIDRPLMHVEREIVVDTETVHESPSTETTVERKATTTRRRRVNSTPSLPMATENENTSPE